MRSSRENSKHLDTKDVTSMEGKHVSDIVCFLEDRIVRHYGVKERDSLERRIRDAFNLERFECPAYSQIKGCKCQIMVDYTCYIVSVRGEKNGCTSKDETKNRGIVEH